MELYLLFLGTTSVARSGYSRRHFVWSGRDDVGRIAYSEQYSMILRWLIAGYFRLRDMKCVGRRRLMWTFVI